MQKKKTNCRHRAVGVFVAIWWIFLGPACAQPDKEVPYSTVATHKITYQIVAHGAVEASGNLALRPRANGEVIAIHARRGDSVKNGALIASLDDGRQQQDLREAKLEHEIAKLQLATGHDQPRAGMNSLESIEILERRLDLAALKVERMEAHIRDCEIRAPIAGKLLSVNMDVHQFVFGPSPFSAGSTVAEIIEDSDYLVTFMLDEVSVARIANGQVCSIRFDAIPSLKATGGIDYIGPVSREPGKQGQFPVSVRFNTASQLIKPGMSAKVEIVIGVSDGLAVPISSIHYSNDISTVLVLDASGVAHAREVTLGIDDMEYVEVSSGLKEGDRIVANQH